EWRARPKKGRLSAIRREVLLVPAGRIRRRIEQLVALRVLGDVLRVTVQHAEVAAAALMPELGLAAKSRVDADTARAGAGCAHNGKRVADVGGASWLYDRCQRFLEGVVRARIVGVRGSLRAASADI